MHRKGVEDLEEEWCTLMTETLTKIKQIEIKDYVVLPLTHTEPSDSWSVIPILIPLKNTVRPKILHYRLRVTYMTTLSSWSSCMMTHPRRDADALVREIPEKSIQFRFLCTDWLIG